MDGIELLHLGRRLVKIAEAAIPANASFHALPVSVRAVMIDVFEHPGTSIQEIIQRTGYPQSHVSASVTRLREGGVFITTTDPKDRRRTLVRASPDVPARAQRFSVPVDDAVAAAVGAGNAAEVLAALETLARHLGG
ncbi:MarR family transcriptional regulator [Actinocrispum sp. NPDC049592]|uniref:helix-turn-helix domain-containing protein n=1 Tax=Actinocrispum sp. NPDC049592 TaxID=3154835 RepID=UPI00341AF557